MSKKQTAALHFNRNPRAEPKRNWLYLNIIVAVILILAGVAALFWLGQQAPSKADAPVVTSMPRQGQPAPDFRLMSLEGKPVSLSDFSGQVVLVNTWATWCPPCKAEMPTLHQFYLDNKDKGFVVLAVNSQEEQSTVSAFIQQQGFTFPVLLDSRAEMMNRYNVRGLPTSFIIGRDGAIKYVHSGGITRKQLEQAVGPLL